MEKNNTLRQDIKIIIVIEDKILIKESAIRYFVTNLDKIHNQSIIINEIDLDNYVKNECNYKYFFIYTIGSIIEDKKVLIDYINNLNKIENKIGMDYAYICSREHLHSKLNITTIPGIKFYHKEDIPLYKEKFLQLKNQIWYSTAESVQVPIFKNFKPTNIIAIASGLKILNIIDAYPTANNIIIVDQNIQALNYVKKAIKEQSSNKVLQKLQQAKFYHRDIKSKKFIREIKNIRNTFFWHSNIWSGIPNLAIQTRHTGRIEQTKYYTKFLRDNQALFVQNQVNGVNALIKENNRIDFVFHDHGNRTDNFFHYKSNKTFSYKRTTLDFYNIYNEIF